MSQGLTSTRFELPHKEGSYRWYYVDFSSDDVTCVVIFMLGPIFSSRYPAAVAKDFPPLVCCAVNVALYRKGKRQCWVLSEYAGANLSPDGHFLELGGSSLRWISSGHWRVEIDERTVAGRRVQVSAEVTAVQDAGQFFVERDQSPIALWNDGLHHWRPLAPRARATLSIDGKSQEGFAYIDTNAGASPLGLGIGRWRWGRVHGPEHTTLYYQPEQGAGFVWEVTGSSGRQPLRGDSAFERSPWWKLPFARLPLINARPSMLEWTPFYARMELHKKGEHALFEVADFAAFQHPICLWMARWRTRVEKNQPQLMPSAETWG